MANEETSRLLEEATLAAGTAGDWYKGEVESMAIRLNLSCSMVRENLILEVEQLLKGDLARFHHVLEPLRRWREEPFHLKRYRENKLKKMMRSECDHSCITVAFNEEECEDKDEFYVRRHYPRFDGECPRCGEPRIKYASSMHYIMGDW